MKKLYSFGYDAFSQTVTTKTINKVLFTSWESTIILNERDEIEFWGYKPSWFEYLKELPPIQSIVGSPNKELTVLDIHQTVWSVTPTGSNPTHHLIKHIIEGPILLTQDGKALQDNRTLDLPPIRHMAGSVSSSLFLSQEGIYGMGLNRFGQVGLSGAVLEPTSIEFFEGLGEVTEMSCGPFHSGVVVEGDVYTMGWSRWGRLGRDPEEAVSFASFPEEVWVVKVRCGAAHTLVLDDQGRVWSCGSNKYGQLGRDLEKDDFDSCFRQCTVFDLSKEKAIDCFSSYWGSFIVTLENN